MPATPGSPPTALPTALDQDAIMKLWTDLQAVVAGKAEWIRRPERKLSEEDQAAFDSTADGQQAAIKPAGASGAPRSSK
jgi:hypothetical protein